LKESRDESAVKEGGRMKDSWERKEFDKRLGRELQKGIDEIPWSEQQELEGLKAVHAAMEGRRMTMRFQGRKMVAVAAVILALTGTITAVAAGKIAIKDIVTDYFELDDIQHALDACVENKADIVKGVIKVG